MQVHAEWKVQELRHSPCSSQISFLESTFDLCLGFPFGCAFLQDSVQMTSDPLLLPPVHLPPMLSGKPYISTA